MACRRCSICNLDWPRLDEYTKCPSCLLPTDPVGNVDSMEEDDARTMKLHYEFDRFYETWDEKMPPERLIPEPVGSTQTGTRLASIDRPEKPA